MPKAKDTIQIKRWVTLPDGRPWRKPFYGKTVEEAEIKWKRERSPVAQTDFPPGSFGWWLVAKWSPLKEGLEINTLDNYALAAGHLLQEFGDDPIRSLDATRIAQGINRIAQKKTCRNPSATPKIGPGGEVIPVVKIMKPLGASLVNKCRSILFEIITLAAEAGACNLVSPRWVKPRKTKRTKIHPYEPREMRRLLEASRGSVAFPFALFGPFLGLTINEARALLDTDLGSDGILRAHFLMKPDGERSAKMKNEFRPREFPLPPGLLDEIRKLARSKGPMCKNKKGELINEGNVNRALASAAARAGLRPFTTHKLRHCFSSWLDDSGCPSTARQELLGQSTEEVAHRYNHPREAVKREWLGKLWGASLEPWEEGEEPAWGEIDKGGTKTPATGERNGRAVLKAEDIPTIRDRLKGESAYAIAKELGVDPAAIRNIRDGKTWKSVG